jgi:hypothetical protein
MSVPGLGLRHTQQLEARRRGGPSHAPRVVEEFRNGWQRILRIGRPEKEEGRSLHSAAGALPCREFDPRRALRSHPG